jgi:multiple sugar transport system ATP-binding protein
MAVIKLENVTKTFGEVTAIKNLSIECPENRIFCLLGPSGAGKSTTLRVIAGLEDPNEGKILIGDKVVNDIPARFRNVAMVFEAYALYPHLTVFDNIAFPLRKIKGLSKEDIKRKVVETAQTLEIDMLLDRKPAFLSGGQRQRVAIGRAIVRDPNVFLFDEPIAHLDAKLREQMRTEIKRLQRALKTTTIYVTHDQIEAMTIADIIAVINLGILHQVGIPEVVYDNPADTFVATFVGSPAMNMFDMELLNENGNSILQAEAFQIGLPVSFTDKIKELTSNKLIMGIRPENIVIALEKVNNDYIESMVYVVEPIGDKIIVDCKIGKDLFRVKTISSKNFKIDQKIWIYFKPDDIRLFVKETGMSL